MNKSGGSWGAGDAIAQAAFSLVSHKLRALLTISGIAIASYGDPDLHGGGGDVVELRPPAEHAGPKPFSWHKVEGGE